MGTIGGVVVFNLGWLLGARRDLARATFAFGLLFLAVLISYAALGGEKGDGYLQRRAIVLLSVGVATLAVRVRAPARSPGIDAREGSSEEQSRQLGVQMYSRLVDRALGDP